MKYKNLVNKLRRYQIYLKCKNSKRPGSHISQFLHLFIKSNRSSLLILSITLICFSSVPKMGSKVTQRMFSIVYCAKTWNTEISVPQIISFRGSIKYFCLISGHKSVFYFIYENGDVLSPLLVQTQQTCSCQQPAVGLRLDLKSTLSADERKNGEHVCLGVLFTPLITFFSPASYASLYKRFVCSISFVNEPHA